MAKGVERIESLIAPAPRRRSAQGKGPGAPKKLRRAEKSESNRQALVQAAIQIIGELGYDGASVSRITERANLAQGTFYIYFPSRQDCFDTVLPELTHDLLEYVASKMHGASGFYEREHRGVLAFFDIVARNPGLFRLINEAQVAAPAAFKRHLDEIIGRYSLAIQRAIDRGEISNISSAQVREISFMLVGARNYLHLAQTNFSELSVDSLADTYMKIVSSALGVARPVGAESQSA